MVSKVTPPTQKHSLRSPGAVLVMGHRCARHRQTVALLDTGKTDKETNYCNTLSP